MVILNGDPAKVLRQTRRNQLLKWLIPIIIASLALFISYLAFNHSVESTKLSNRPFIVVMEAFTSMWPAMRKNLQLEELNNLQANIKIMNAGSTPAFNVVMKSAISIYGEAFIDDPEYRDFIWEERILVNDQIYEVYAHSFRKFTQDELNDAVDKKKFFYAYGEITYTDIFEEKHVTRFCFQRSDPWTWVQIDKYSDVE